jgi:hypothetical protein
MCIKLLKNSIYEFLVFMIAAVSNELMNITGSPRAGIRENCGGILNNELIPIPTKKPKIPGRNPKKNMLIIFITILLFTVMIAGPS